MNARQKLHDWALRHLSSPLYHALGKWYYRYWNRRKQPEGRPPRHLSFVYGYDPEFDQVGELFLGYFKSLCNLQPNHVVLDVGCGIGRCAMPLTGYLSPQGRYDGFDIREDGVTWCAAHITPRFPNFRFQHLDIANATYHPDGDAQADQVRFPYPDDNFDLVFTKSVFTHLQAPVIQHYLRETARVLRPGGVSLHTFFVLNDETRAAQTAGNAQFNFVHPMPHGAAVSASEPEKAIAFEETAVRAWYAEAGLEIEEPIRFGQWSARPGGLSGQDIVIARRPI